LRHFFRSQPKLHNTEAEVVAAVLEAEVEDMAEVVAVPEAEVEGMAEVVAAVPEAEVEGMAEAGAQVAVEATEVVRAEVEVVAAAAEAGERGCLTAPTRR